MAVDLEEAKDHFRRKLEMLHEHVQFAVSQRDECIDEFLRLHVHPPMALESFDILRVHADPLGREVVFVTRKVDPRPPDGDDFIDRMKGMYPWIEFAPILEPMVCGDPDKFAPTIRPEDRLSYEETLSLGCPRCGHVRADLQIACREPERFREASACRCEYLT